MTKNNTIPHGIQDVLDDGIATDNLEPIQTDKIFQSTQATKKRHRTRSKIIYEKKRDEGFIKVPRSLRKDSLWKVLSLRERHVFETLLENVCFSKTDHDIHGKVITLLPGQYCCTNRRLVDLCNESVSSKEDKVSLGLVQRAVSKFFNYGWIDTDTDTGKTIFNITYPDLYEHFQRLIDTQTDTKPIQKRYTNEEREEGKNVEETIRGVRGVDSFLLNNEEKKGPTVFKPSSKAKELLPEKQKHFEFIWKFIVEKGIAEGMPKKPGIKENDLAAWLKKYKPEDIAKCIELALKAEIKSTWPGYITQLLKKDVSKKEDASKVGKEYVANFIKQRNINHIEMMQDYFKDLTSPGDASKYDLPIDTIKVILEKSCERAKEQEENRNDYEENN